MSLLFFLFLILPNITQHKRAERGWKESTNDKHFTETALDDATGWDFTFENDDDGEENALLMAKQITAEISKAPQVCSSLLFSFLSF